MRAPRNTSYPDLSVQFLYAPYNSIKSNVWILSGKIVTTTPIAFHQFLKNNRQYFYHFTDSRNIEDIRKHGLLATADLNWGGIDFYPGGDKESLLIDERKGLDKYVHLCFCGEHPMEYRARLAGRIKDSVFLKIDPSVILQEGVLIADRVSTANDAVIKSASDMLPTLDLFPIYNWMDWKDQKIKSRVDAARKYELLVPNIVPVDMIIGL